MSKALFVGAAGLGNVDRQREVAEICKQWAANLVVNAKIDLLALQKAGGDIPGMAEAIREVEAEIDAGI